MKLPGFPIPVPGEAFTSVVARHLVRTSTLKARHLNWLGLKISQGNSIIPYDLRHFTSTMPLGHPWEDAPEAIAKGHTLVPLFLHFAHPERAEATVNAIVSGNMTATASLRFSTHSLRNQQRAGRFCPECIAADVRAFGFPILYRQHQPPFVSLCAKHAIPLHFHCLHCQNNQNMAAKWQIAGCCDCHRPRTPPVVERELDSKTGEGRLWLSEQVTSILASENPLPTVPIAAGLVAALRNSGFVSPNGSLDPNLMTEALFDRFSESFLREVGFGSWCDPAGIPRSHLPKTGMIDGRRIPFVLRMLLLARLVTEDVASLANNALTELARKKDLPPIEDSRQLTRSPRNVEKDAIIAALNATKWKISVAAQHLGVRFNRLVADLRHFGIRVPLRASTANRLGEERIDAIREALRRGLSRREIQRRYDIAGWTIILIEVDRPELREIHRRAAITRLQEKHRDTLQAFLRENPGAYRQAFTTRHRAANKWLQKHDQKWFNTCFPKQRLPGPKGSTASKNWYEIDQRAVQTLQDAVRQELAKPERPILLSRSRLLTVAGALSAMTWKKNHHYPAALAEAARLAETNEQFKRRVIRWALQQYVGHNRSITATRLSGITRIDKRKLIKYREYIIEVAAELGLPFHAQCVLAP